MTMPKDHVNPASLSSECSARVLPVVVASGAKTVFISGQTAWDCDQSKSGPHLDIAFAAALPMTGSQAS